MAGQRELRVAGRSIYGEGVIGTESGEAGLAIVCRGIEYRFSIFCAADGVVVFRKTNGSGLYFLNDIVDIDFDASRSDCFNQKVGELVVRNGTLVFADDNALQGCLRILMSDIEYVNAEAKIRYKYRWDPYVARKLDEVREIFPAQFHTRARLLNQLGEQLIKNESVALLELIKNAYDADATLCDIVLRNPQSISEGEIEILDDGCGMTPEIVRDVWFEIGTDHKKVLMEDPKTLRTPKFGRLRLGEKGIGRLGVHRLGRRIELITKSAASDKEVCVCIDWRKTETANLIEDIPVVCETRKPEVFLGGNTGTKIIISDFREPWSKRLAVESARTIAALNSPFESDDSFHAIFKITGDENESAWLEKIPTFLDIKDQSLFSFDIRIKGCRIKSFSYRFDPWPALTLVQSRKVCWDETNPTSLMVYPRGVYELWDGILFDENRCGKPIDVSDIGEIRFSGVVFDLSTKLLSLGTPDKSALKIYLRQNCGVKIFRSNMRILDYGEPGNDWLGLNARKLGKSSAHISNSVIMAAVNLDSATSRALREKANREGFIEDDAYNRLKAALTFCLERLDAEWRHDKELLKRNYESDSEDARVPVTSSLQELKGLVEGSKLEDVDKKRFLRCVIRIEKEYETMTGNLIKAAGAGLNLVMVIHQMEKVVDEAQAALRANADSGVVSGLMNHLEELVGGYSVILKKSEIKSQDIVPIVEQSIFNVGFRLRAHKITVERAYEGKRFSKGVCARGHLVNALINLLDNAIWWLGYFAVQEAGIYVDITEALPGFVTIVIADNGRGFTLPIEEIEKPFVSAKPGGMGIGLHLTSEIMRYLGGRLVLSSREVFNVPEKYRGAVVALALRKESLG